MGFLWWESGAGGGGVGAGINIKFVDLYGNCLDIELGSADRTQLFTTARRQQAINDAMHNFERIVSCTPAYNSILMVSGQAEYDLLATFPNFISMFDQSEPGIQKTDPSGNVTWIQGDDLPYRTPQWNDHEMPGWRADPSSTPASWYIREDAGTTFIGVDPAPLIPAGWTYNILVPYLATSTDMVADTDVPFTVNGKAFARLVPYYKALCHYAAAQLEMLRKNTDGYTFQMQKYAGYVTQFEQKKHRDAPAQVTFARNYLRDATTPRRPVDPHRFP